MNADFIKIAGVPIDDNGRMLVVKKKNEPVWISLGGKLEAGESNEGCLIRESEEELNLSSDQISDIKHLISTEPELAAGSHDKWVVLKFYTMKITGDFEIDNDELDEYRWVNRKEFDQMVNDESIEVGSGLIKFAVPRLIELQMMR